MCFQMIHASEEARASLVQEKALLSEGLWGPGWLHSGGPRALD